MKRFWNIRMSAKEPKTAVLDFYGDIEGDYYDWWSGEKIESETSARHIRDELRAYGKLDRVELHINSMGGSVYEANAIANMLRRLDCDTVAYIDAFACSAASVIAVACNTVKMPRNAVMMIHNPWMWARGNATELRKAASDLDVLGEAFRSIYLDKAGEKLDEKQLVKMLDAETYLTAEQAEEYGLCDEIEQFDAVLHEPDNNAKQTAAKNHVDLGKVCAMMRGEELQAHADEDEKKPETPDTPEPEPERPEPEVKAPEISEKSEHEAFAEKAMARVLNFYGGKKNDDKS